MKKIIVMPDSFKGTMASHEVSEIIRAGLLNYFDPKDIITIPIADGGEGTVDCFMHFTNASRISLKAKGPLMNDIITSYAIFDNTAIIETASVAGYSLSPNITTPLNTTTYGIGQLVNDAINRGCKKVILGLGGSCTNDAGVGLAAALGAKFTDALGNEFIPVGKNLGLVEQIDLSEIKKRLKGIEIIGMCDITNTLYGKNGAAYMFAPQKGASPDDVILLDQQLRLLSKTIKDRLYINVDDLEGGAAAGGMGAGIYAFLGGKLLSGINLILDMVEFDKLLDTCDFIITGEGKFDQQSLGGKAIAGICNRAKKKNVPVIVIAGERDISLNGDLETYGIQAVFETGKLDLSKPIAEIHTSSKQALYVKSNELGSYLSKSYST